jgi:hypothetical protein
MQQATKLKGEFLSIKLSTLPKEKLFNIITHANHERSNEEKDERANKILQSNEFEDVFYCESEDDDVLVSTLHVESLLGGADGDDDDQEEGNDDLFDAVDDEDFVSQPLCQVNLQMMKDSPHPHHHPHPHHRPHLHPHHHHHRPHPHLLSW